MIYQCCLNLHDGTFNGKLHFLCCASDVNHESFDQIILEKALFSLSVGQWLPIWRGLRSSPPEVFLRKGVLKICSKFTGEDPCQSVISKKAQSNFIEITLWHGCSPVNSPHIFRASFSRKAFGGLPLRVLLQRKSTLTENSCDSSMTWSVDVWKTLSTWYLLKLILLLLFGVC